MADFLHSLDKHDVQVLACAIGIAFVFVVLAFFGPRGPRR